MREVMNLLASLIQQNGAGPKQFADKRPGECELKIFERPQRSDTITSVLGSLPLPALGAAASSPSCEPAAPPAGAGSCAEAALTDKAAEPTPPPEITTSATAQGGGKGKRKMSVAEVTAAILKSGTKKPTDKEVGGEPTTAPPAKMTKKAPGPCAVRVEHDAAKSIFQLYYKKLPCKVGGGSGPGLGWGWRRARGLGPRAARPWGWPNTRPTRTTARRRGTRPPRRRWRKRG